MTPTQTTLYIEGEITQSFRTCALLTGEFTVPKPHNNGWKRPAKKSTRWKAVVRFKDLLTQKSVLQQALWTVVPDDAGLQFFFAHWRSLVFEKVNELKDPWKSVGAAAAC